MRAQCIDGTGNDVQPPFLPTFARHLQHMPLGVSALLRADTVSARRTPESPTNSSIVRAIRSRPLSACWAHRSSAAIKTFQASSVIAMSTWIGSVSISTSGSLTASQGLPPG